MQARATKSRIIQVISKNRVEDIGLALSLSVKHNCATFVGLLFDRRCAVV